jgi:hypothetical protein
MLGCLFPVNEVSMDTRKSKQPLYILWLIRNGHARSYGELLLHFGENPSGLAMSSVPFLVQQSVEKLRDAGLIRMKSGKLETTELASKIRDILGYSLTELAKHDPYESMLVSPIFGQPRDEKYSYDLFVLMPFRSDLHPIYEDHIKAVASELNMRIARADDFFTTHSIIDEIWSAIYQSKFIIADCTDRNPNVFYEIGIAHSVGKPVVIITKDIDDVPFDLRHRRFIKYEYTPRGMKEFEIKLQSVLTELRDEQHS